MAKGTRARRSRQNINKALHPVVARAAQMRPGITLGDAINYATGPSTQPLIERPMPRDPLDLAEFGPNRPLYPAPIDRPRKDTGRPEPRLTEYPVAWNLPGNGQRLTPWATLRGAAEMIDIVRRCIEIRKQHIVGLDWAFSLTEKSVFNAYEADPSKGRIDVEAELRQKFLPEIDRLTQFWMEPWKAQGWDFIQWVKALMEEHLVCDGVPVYPSCTYGGEVLGLEILDATTIKPLLDWRGARPQQPYPAYQQNIQGYVRGEFHATGTDLGNGDVLVESGFLADQLFYYVGNTRSFTPYGYSAVEQALISARLYLKRQGWMLAEYDDGSTPLMWLVPAVGSGAGKDGALNGLNPRQRRQWEDALNDDLAGQTAARHRIKMTPPGFSPIPMASVDERYKPEYDLYLVKMLAGHFGVTSTELGFSEAKGLGNSGLHEGQEATQDRVATQPDVRMVASIINKLSRDFLKCPPEIEFKFTDPANEDTVAEDGVRAAQRERGTITLNDDRKAIGLAPLPIPEADMAMTTAQWIPLEGTKERADQAAEMEQAAAEQSLAMGDQEMAMADSEASAVDKALERTALRRWRRRADRGRSFLCKALTPEDFPAGQVPEFVEFEGWAWVPDGMTLDEATAIDKGDGWRHQLRDRKGRWMKMGTHGPALPGKQVLAGLKEQAEAQRRVRAATHSKTNESSTTMGGMSAPEPKPMTQQRAAKVGETRVTVALKRGTSNSVVVKHGDEVQYTAYAEDGAAMDAILQREVDGLSPKPTPSAADELAAARQELRDAEAAHAKTWGAKPEVISRAAGRVNLAEHRVKQAEEAFRRSDSAAPEVPTPTRNASDTLDAANKDLNAVEHYLAVKYGAGWEEMNLPAQDLALWSAASDAVRDARRIDEHKGKIREAHAALTNGSPVNLADVRQRIGGSRADQDAALSAMARTGEAVLWPEENQRAITAADRAAALRMGGEDKHLLHIEGARPAAVPERDRAAYAAAKAAVDAVPGLREGVQRQQQRTTRVGDPVGADGPVVVREAAPVAGFAIPRTPPSADHEAADTARVLDAFERVVSSRQGAHDIVGLREIREAMGGTRADQDRALTAMARSFKGVLWPEENQKTITDADRAAALHLGGEDKHLLHVLPEHRKPRPDATPAPTPTPEVTAPEAPATSTPTVAARSVTNIDRVAPERQANLREVARKLDERHAAFFASNRAELERDLTSEREYLAMPEVTGDERKQHEAVLASLETLAATPRGDAAVAATKGARELIEAADAQGMIVMVSHSSSMGAGGGSPYFEIQAVSPDMTRGFKATFHTFKGKNGSYGYMSGDVLADGRWKGGKPSLAAMREATAPKVEPTVDTTPAPAVSEARKMSTPDIQAGDWRWNEGLKGWEQIGMIADRPDAVGSRTIWGMDRETRLGALPRDTQTWVARQTEMPTAPPPPAALRALQREPGAPVKRGDLYVVERKHQDYVVGSGRANERTTYEVHEVTSVTREGRPKAVRDLRYGDYSTPVDRLGREYGKVSIIPGDAVDKAGLEADLKARTYTGSTTPKAHDNIGELSTTLFGRVKPETWAPAASPAAPEPKAPRTRTPRAKAAPDAYAKLLTDRGSDSYVTHAPSRSVLETMRADGWELQGTSPGGVTRWSRNGRTITAAAPGTADGTGAWKFYDEGRQKLTQQGALDYVAAARTAKAPTPTPGLSSLSGNPARSSGPVDFGHGSVEGSGIRAGMHVYLDNHKVEVLEAPRRARPDSEGRAGVVFRVKRLDGPGEGTARVNEGTTVPVVKPTGRISKAEEPDPKAEAAPAAPDGRWPAWLVDTAVALAGAAALTAAISAAVGGAVGLAGLAAAAIERWRGRKTPTREQVRRWMNTELDARQALVRAIAPVVRDIHAEGWLAGAKSAEAVLDHIEATMAEPMSPALQLVVDWGAWAPGDPEAARQVLSADGREVRLEQLLGRSGVEIKNLADGRLDELAAVLADGLERGASKDEIATALQGIVDNRNWAEMTAWTEANRATSAAALDQYDRDGIPGKEWMTAFDQRVCPRCGANEDQGPIPLGDKFSSGDLHPPGHPRCRCGLLPALDWAALGVELDDIDKSDDGDNNLEHYWKHGDGRAKWVDNPHPWTALYRHLRTKVGGARAKRIASQWFHDVFGMWPGERKGKNPVGKG